MCKLSLAEVMHFRPEQARKEVKRKLFKNQTIILKGFQNYFNSLIVEQLYHTDKYSFYIRDYSHNEEFSQQF